MNIPTQIDLRSVGSLLPNARNSRTHSDEQVAQIAASIKEFGWTNPVLVGADGVIIAGHARVLAARKLGMDEVPVIALAHLTPAQRRALVIADNKLALNAGWDEETLRAEMAWLDQPKSGSSRRQIPLSPVSARIYKQSTCHPEGDLRSSWI